MKISEKKKREKLFDKAQKDWESKKITREQFREALQEMGYKESLAELIIDDLEGESLEKKLSNIDENTAEALIAAIRYLSKHGRNRGYMMTEKETEDFIKEIESL